ncbi:reverse transcriptase domain-containing protein [Tanacetum coccineum]
MTWHATGKCIEPGKMQHPVDGGGMEKFDTNQAYNMWPVILTTYNLPPWLCMKESSFMLTLLIPGPKSPGNDIDVYLRPLIEYLKDRLGCYTCVGPGCCFCGGGFGVGVGLGVSAVHGGSVAGSEGEMSDDVERGMVGRVGEGGGVGRVGCAAGEAFEGGPIRPRWLYPFERYTKKLKGYVRNKAKPEGSIAEGYVAEEALTFSSHYFLDVTTKFNRPDHNVDPPPPTCRFQVFRSVGNDQDLEVSTTSELFALASGLSWTPVSVNSCVVDGVSLNDLNNATLHIDGQSTVVDAPPDIIDVPDEDDDIIGDEDALPHDLADSDVEDLINVDDDGVEKVYSSEEED